MLLEDRFLYYPDRTLRATPRDVGLDFEELSLEAADGVRLQAWHVPAAAPTRARLLFFHGNAGNIGDRVEHALHLRRLGLDVLLLEYRGYGQSGGRPSEKGLYLDAQAALAWSVKRGGRQILFGESLGGAVAIDLAAQGRCDALIVQSTFTSVPDMAAAVFPWLPFRPPLRNRFASIEKIPRVTCPKLLLHGDADEIVPFAQGQALHRTARDPKQLIVLQGAHHNDTWLVRPNEYFGGIDAFLRRHGI
jgi:fermentation-respiration switch protein FrsA (DUF1100 family)